MFVVSWLYESLVLTSFKDHFWLCCDSHHAMSEGMSKELSEFLLILALKMRENKQHFLHLILFFYFKKYKKWYSNEEERCAICGEVVIIRDRSSFKKVYMVGLGRNLWQVPSQESNNWSEKVLLSIKPIESSWMKCIQN